MRAGVYGEGRSLRLPGLSTRTLCQVNRSGSWTRGLRVASGSDPNRGLPYRRCGRAKTVWGGPDSVRAGPWTGYRLSVGVPVSPVARLRCPVSLIPPRVGPVVERRRRDPSGPRPVGPWVPSPLSRHTPPLTPETGQEFSVFEGLPSRTRPVVLVDSPRLQSG